jgi:hypothetical protein
VTLRAPPESPLPALRALAASAGELQALGQKLYL